MDEAQAASPYERMMNAVSSTHPTETESTIYVTINVIMPNLIYLPVSI